MTTLANSTVFVTLGNQLQALRAAFRRQRDASHQTWVDQHFRRQREARERYLSRARDPFELERLERAFDRGGSEPWRVF